MLLNMQRKQYFYLVALIISSFDLLKVLLFYSLFNFIVLFIFMSIGGVNKKPLKIKRNDLYYVIWLLQTKTMIRKGGTEWKKKFQ